MYCMIIADISISIKSSCTTLSVECPYCIKLRNYLYKIQGHKHRLSPNVSTRNWGNDCFLDGN